MRQEMKSMTLYSECDGYSDDECGPNSKNDQPVDLRVCSVLERDNTNFRNEKSKVKEKSENNFILASLLTRNSSSVSSPHSNYNSYTVPHSKYNSYTVPHSKREGSSKYRSPLPLETAYLQKVSGHYDNDETSYHDSKISITDRLKIKQGFMDKYHKSWSPSHSPGLNPTSTSSVSIICDNPKDSLGKIAKNFDFESKALPEREFVPNYRKFYSRCSNQSPAPTQSSNRTAQEFNPVNLDTSCTIIKERLSSSTTTPNPWTSTGHLYRLLQRDRMNPNSIPPIKRKISYPIEPNTDDISRKDKTLRCLLSTSVDEKEYSIPANARHSPDQSSYPDKPFDYNLIKNRLKLKLDSVSKNDIYPRSIHSRSYDIGKNEAYRGPLHPSYRSDYGMRPPYVYCPQPVRAVPGDTVLKSILVSECKIPAPILPTSGPPSSGSPGSESTSSGSTDSGVFSDNVLDDRRRVTRVLSGRHVKSGTGASLSTLRLLRQMIIQRKNRADRKL